MISISEIIIAFSIGALILKPSDYKRVIRLYAQAKKFGSSLYNEQLDNLNDIVGQEIFQELQENKILPKPLSSNNVESKLISSEEAVNQQDALMREFSELNKTILAKERAQSNKTNSKKK